MNFFKAGWKRLQADTPLFFKKIRRIGISLTAAGGSCLVPEVFPNVKMPPILTTFGTDAVIAGFIMGLVASFACQDPNDIHKDVDPNQPPKS